MITKKYLIAAMLATATVATPQAAFAQNIATADNTVVIGNSTALRTAYQQISAQYQNNINTINTRNTEIQSLEKSFDTNNDGALDENEQNAARTNTNVINQIRQKTQEVNTLQEPIILAQLYVVDQLLGKYNDVIRDVVAKDKIDVILSPGSYTYLKPGANVTKKLTDTLNQMMPAAQIAPPPNWRPTQAGTVSIHQDVQKLFTLRARQQAAKQQAQQQQQPAAAPSSR